jgi:tetratricopeptide (TPR) repeat protein
MAISGDGNEPPLRLRRTIVTCIGLVLAVWAVYGQSVRFEFVNFDDDVHVFENPHVVSGFTRENLIWDFGIHGPSQWHPLAWLSHQADWAMFAANAGGHHTTNVVLHAVAAMLLFLSMQRMTLTWGPAAFTAAAFAVHPLNVESVAWISERRNLLCAVFWMAALWCYAGYARRPGWCSYLGVVFCHALALMSKPMAVTLPCVLLLLDIWPLQRLHFGNWRKGAAQLLLEKIPLLGLSVAAGVLSILCQRAVGTVATLDAISFSLRLVNAAASYGWYLQKTIWPTGLTCFYPHPALVESAPWQRLAPPCLAGSIAIAGATLLAMRHRRDHPWLLVGWLWFLGVLAPMIGLLQVGDQAHADRYSYLCQVGLFLAAGWTGRQFASQSRQLARRMMFISLALLCGWAVAAHQQAAAWHDSISLFSRALEVNNRNHWAHNNLGFALLQQGKKIEALEHFREAVAIVPTYVLGHYNLGVCLHELRDRDGAIAHLETSLKYDPTSAAVHQRLAAVLAETGQLPKAIDHFREAVRLLPDDGQAHFNLGLALARAGRDQEAIDALRRAHELRWDEVSTLLLLASEMRRIGNVTDARATVEEVLNSKPHVADGQFLLGEILRDTGDIAGARDRFRETLRLRPDWPPPRTALEQLDDVQQKRNTNKH